MFRIPKINLIYYELSDLKDMTALEEAQMKDLRKEIDILIIDDQSFPAEEYLRHNGFNLTHKKDIDSIKDTEAYAVVLCDIKGVGTKLGSSKEGAFIIKEIKLHYPSKQVIAYTGSSYDAGYNDLLNYADTVIKKGMAVEDWVEVLDGQIKNAVDPVYQWKRLRTNLLGKGVSTRIVAKIEDEYVKAIRDKTFDNLVTSRNTKEAKVHALILELAASTLAKIITGDL